MVFRRQLAAAVSMLCAVVSLPVSAADRSATGPLAASNSWGRGQAAHLLRRAGFGGTPAQIDYLAEFGRAEAVAYLVNYESIPFTPVAVEVQSYGGKMREARRNGEEGQKLRMQLRQLGRLQYGRVVRWWTETMVASPRPLEEKLTLFWHGHFTSGFQEVKSSYLLYQQNNMLRRHANGNLRDFLLAVTEDPAMILYLNTQQNRKGKPNENYARELLELFTMGPGHYTEKDIKEAARAFTGIGINPMTGTSLYRDRQHDFGEKTFLGRKGDFGPPEIIDIILQQPATAEFIAERLWEFFAYESPEPELVQALGAVYRKGNYELKPLLTAMFNADAFYGKRAKFTHIKSPVELMVGTARLLEVTPIDTESMVVGMRSMGQTLMQPPNVAGWDGGAAWITTSTLYNRYNTLGQLIAGTEKSDAHRQRRRRVNQLAKRIDDEDLMIFESDVCPPQPALDATTLLKSVRIKSDGDVVDYFVARLLQRDIDAKRRQELIDAIAPHFDDTKPRSKKNADALRGLIHLIVSMPEYQLS